MGVFDQAEDWVPPFLFLILDGRGTRFDLLILQYINTPSCNEMEPRLHWGAIWHIILASRGKSRTRQNGFFKMALVTKCKRDLLTQRERRRRAAFAVEKDDILTRRQKHEITNALPISLQTKKLLLNEVGIHWTATCCSIRKFNWQVLQIWKQKQTIIKPPLPFPHMD